MRRDHHTISDTGAWRFGPVVVRDDEIARAGLELVHRVQTDPDADRNEWTEAAMYPRSQSNPLVLGFRFGANGHPKKQGEQSKTRAFHRSTLADNSTVLQSRYSLEDPWLASLIPAGYHGQRDHRLELSSGTKQACVRPFRHRSAVAASAGFQIALSLARSIRGRSPNALYSRSGVLIDFRYRARPSGASDAPQRIPDAVHPVGLRLVTPKVNTIERF